MPLAALKTAARLFALVLTTVVAIWVYRAHLARDLPELQIWHTYKLESEFKARDYPDGIGFAEYAELEQRIAAELDTAVYSDTSVGGRFNRFDKSSEAWPGNDGQRWNRSFTLPVDNPSGGILLMHGASDSPYSTRALAKAFSDAGLFVVSVRLPGNGTIPSGLKYARVEDWIAISRMGVAHVRESIGPGLPIYVAGYSVGGALALNYALDSMADDDLETPDRLFLYTPAIGVSSLAGYSNWDLALAKLPVFEKFNWMGVEPEFDPYKYNSFAKAAGHATYQLTEKIASKLQSLDDPSRLPPMIAFQSLVDSTVDVDVLVDRLFGRLSANGSELVLFDINRAHYLEHFINDIGAGLISRLEAHKELPYSFTLVGNTNGNSVDVVARTRLAGSSNITTTPLDDHWPDDTYSLSHVAIVFPPDDRWYGRSAVDRYTLGTLAPRGENAILTAPIARFMRLRHNPFYDYVAERTLEFCDVCTMPGDD